MKAPRARRFGSLAARLSHYQISNLDATGWSRLLAVCICAAGVDTITMLEERRSLARFFAASPRSPTQGTEDMQAIIARERAAGVDGLAVAEVTYPHAAENDVLSRVHTAGLTRVYSTGRAHGPTASRDRTPTIPGYRDRLEIRSGEPLLKSPGDLS